MKRILKKIPVVRKMAMRQSLSQISPVLLYHSVDDIVNSDNLFLQGTIHNVTPDIFYQQMKTLQKRYTFIPVDEYVERLKNGKSLKGVSSLTFDDGYASNITVGLKVMEELKIPGTVYLTGELVKSKSFWRDRVRYLEVKGLIPDFLDYASKKNSAFDKLSVEGFYSDSKDPSVIGSKIVDEVMKSYFSQNEIDLTRYSQGIYCSKEMLLSVKSDYLILGNHSMSHYVMSTLTLEEQQEELGNCNELLKSLNLPISNLFSIPFGGESTINQNTLKALSDLSFDGCLFSNGYRLKDASMIPKKFEVVAATRFMPRQHDRF